MKLKQFLAPIPFVLGLLLVSGCLTWVLAHYVPVRDLDLKAISYTPINFVITLFGVVGLFLIYDTAEKDCHNGDMLCFFLGIILVLVCHAAMQILYEVSYYW